MFLYRIMNEPQAWIEDIADIYWMEIYSKKVNDAAIKYINGQASEWFAKDLSQDERTVLVTYVNVYSRYKKWETSMIQSLIMNSIDGWSQIIALELN
jgi:hypothetical protein